MPTAIQVWLKRLEPTLQQMTFLIEQARNPDVLMALTAIDELCKEAEAVREAAVREAKLQGATWEELGNALGGISRQAAWERYKARMNGTFLSLPHERPNLAGTL